MFYNFYTSDFTYVADQEAIASAQEELANSQVDLINWEQDEINKADQEKLDEKSKYLARVKTIMDRALNGEYASFEDFQIDMTNLNREYMGNMDLINSTEWNDIFTSTQTNLDSIESAYSTYVTNLEELAVKAKQALQDILNAQAAAQAASEAAENETATTPETPTTTTTTIELERDPNGPSTKVVKSFVKKFDTGGFTDDNEGLAYLDKKEIVLNQSDTSNFLKSVEISKSILDSLKGFDLSKIPMVNMLSNFKPIDIASNLISKTSQSVSNTFNIDNISFPNVLDASGIEDAFKSLPLLATQKAKRQYGQ